MSRAALPTVHIPSTKTVLPNGLTLIVAPNRSLATVNIVTYCDSGVLNEPEEKAGLSNLLSMVLDEGSRRRSGEAIHAELESFGVSLSVGTSGASLAAPSAELERGVRVLAEVLLTPRIPEEAVRRKKAQVLSEILADEDDPQVKASQQFRELIYGKHPLHRPSVGYAKTVSRIRRRDLVEFHKRFYGPERSIIAVAGDVNPKSVLRIVTKYFGKWRSGSVRTSRLPAIPVLRGRKVKILSEKHQQVQIFLGHLGIRRTHPNYYTLLVMDHILGTGPGFTDRLSRKLRDEQGLAYTVSASITSSAGMEPGFFRAYIGTSPSQFQQAVRGILQEIRAIRSKGVSDEELRLAKDYLLGSYLFGIEKNYNRASFLINSERFGLGKDYLDKYLEKIEKVTARDVLDAARRHLDPDRYVLVAVGRVKR